MNNLQAYPRKLWQFLGEHQFGVMLFGSVAIACLMVWVALVTYSHSDASRLDLSHPDYKPLRSQISTDKSNGLLGTGPINEEFLAEFDKLFQEQVRQATEIDAFSGDVLSDEALGITP